MEKIRSWEANRFSINHEIPSVLRYPKIHNHIQNRPAPFTIINQINPVHVTRFEDPFYYKSIYAQVFLTVFTSGVLNNLLELINDVLGCVLEAGILCK